MAIPVTINGRQQQLDVPNEMPLLWGIREAAGLTGTKYACGVAQCGACTVHLDGQPVRACVTPTSAARGRRVTTIEGLDAKGEHPLQKAWVEEQVPQCGYCQSGQIMSAAALLPAKPSPTDAEPDADGDKLGSDPARPTPKLTATPVPGNQP